MLTISRYDRFYAVYDDETLVCVCVYKKGAMEIINRLNQIEAQEA